MRNEAGELKSVSKANLAHDTCIMKFLTARYVLFAAKKRRIPTKRELPK